MAALELVPSPKTVTLTFSLEPAYNIIGSLSLLGVAEGLTGLGERIYHTVRA